MRNNFRHYFLKSPQRKLLYDVITWAATQVAVSYTVVPFVLLSVKPSFAFYRWVLLGSLALGWLRLGKTVPLSWAPRENGTVAVFPAAKCTVSDFSLKARGLRMPGRAFPRSALRRV